MAEEQRVQPKNLFSYIIILAIVLVFVFEFGPGSRACDAPNSRSPSTAAATVNGKDLPLLQLQRAYAQRVDQLEANGMSADFARQFTSANSILEGLIAHQLLQDAAEHAGVVATDDEVLRSLKSFKSFQKDGAFDVTQYENVVRANYGQTPTYFEDQLRKELAVQKMRATVQDTVNVSADEVRASYEKDANVVNVAFVRFLPAMYADKVKKPTDAEVKADVKAHSKEIADEYAANKATYHTPERLHLRRILLRAPKNATDAQRTALLQRAADLRKEIASGKDFSEVAKASSDDTSSKARGGDLGFQAMTALVPAARGAATGLKDNEVSAPVDTPFGTELYQLVERKPAEDRALDDKVKAEIAAQRIKKSKAQNLAKADADKALAALEKGKGKGLKEQFPKEKAEKEEQAASPYETPSKPQVQTTGEIATAGDTVGPLGVAPELAKDVFAAQGPLVLRRVYPLNEGFVVAQVTERKHPTEADFQKEREKLTQQALDARRSEVMDSYEKALRKLSTVKIHEDVVAGVGKREES